MVVLLLDSTAINLIRIVNLTVRLVHACNALRGRARVIASESVIQGEADRDRSRECHSAQLDLRCSVFFPLSLSLSVTLDTLFSSFFNALFHLAAKSADHAIYSDGHDIKLFPCLQTTRQAQTTSIHTYIYVTYQNFDLKRKNSKSLSSHPHIYVSFNINTKLISILIINLS